MVHRRAISSNLVLRNAYPTCLSNHQAISYTRLSKRHASHLIVLFPHLVYLEEEFHLVQDEDEEAGIIHSLS
jgi:hypothetical protein